MAIYDKAHGGYRVFIGDLGSRVGKYELERELDYYGNIMDVWVARSPPGFAFVVYKYPEDAEKAVRDLHGSTLCGRRVRAEHAVPYDSRRSRRGPPPRYVTRYDSQASRSRSRDGRSRSRDRRRRSRSRQRSRSRSRSRTRSRDRKRSPKSQRSRSHEKSRSRRRTDSERTKSPARNSKTRSKSRDNKASSASPETKKEKQNGAEKKHNGADKAAVKQNGEVSSGD